MSSSACFQTARSTDGQELYFAFADRVALANFRNCDRPPDMAEAFGRAGGLLHEEPAELIIYLVLQAFGWVIYSVRMGTNPWGVVAHARC